MRKRDLIVVVLSVLVSACGGGGGGGETEGVGDVGEIGVPDGGAEAIAAFCEANPGAECEDDDPCSTGKGVCMVGEAGAICLYEESAYYTCDQPPDDCSAGGQCDGTGGCTWELADGWCRIDAACVEQGTLKPGADCMACVPDADRGTWSPTSGGNCDPGENPCTKTGKCQEGFCVPVAQGDLCASDFDCIEEDDGDLCNGVMRCKDCACVFDAGSAVTCDTSADTPCVKTECVPDTGECAAVTLPDGTGCDDGDVCTTGDACLAGECAGKKLGEPTWTASASPVTAYMTSVETVAGTSPLLFAAGSGGVVYKSKDGGNTFTSSDILASGGSPGDWLVLAETKPVGVMVIFEKTLFVSIDEGQTFSQKLAGCEAVARVATAGTQFVAVCQKQVQVSNDSGATWAPVGPVPGQGGASVTALAAQSASTLFVGLRDEDGQGRGYVHRTQDGGMSWSQVDPPDRPADAYVSAHGLLVSPKASDKVFLGYTNTQAGAFPFGTVPLFRSDDMGSTWVPLNANTQGSSWVPLATDTIGRLLLGVDTRLNRGGSFGNGPWGLIPEAIPSVGILPHVLTDGAVAQGNEFSFLLPASNGLALAMNLGAEYKLLNGGMNGGVYAVVRACGAAGGMVSQDMLSGALFRTTDNGATWQGLPVPAAAAGRRAADIACSADGKAIYVFFNDGGLMVSKDGGTVWQAYSEGTGPVAGSIGGLSSGMGTPNRIFAARKGFGGMVAEDGAFEQGSGFLPIGVPEAYVLSVMVDASDSNVAYVGTRSSPDGGPARIYVCQNAGKSCSMRLQGPAAAGAAVPAAFQFAADMQVSGRVFAVLTGESPALYYTSDYGNSWETMTALPLQGTDYHGALLADQDVKGSLYVAFRGHPVYRYDAAKSAWSVLNASPAGVSSLVYHPAGDGKILAASINESKVYVSADGGETWSLFKDFTSPDFGVYRLISEEGHLFAILHGRGIGDGMLYRYEGGQWSKSSIDVPVLDVAIQAGEPYRVLASGRLGGVFASEDGGATFAAFGSLDSVANDLLVPTGESQTVYAAVACGMLPQWYDAAQTFIGSECGVRRSSDGGVTWFTTLNTSGNACVSLAQPGGNSQMLLATCPGSGTYVTDTGAMSWDNLSNLGLGSDMTARLKFANTVVAGSGQVFFGTGDRGLVRADVSSENWTLSGFDAGFGADTGKLAPVTEASLAVDPFDSARLAVFTEPGGLTRTDLFGSVWRPAELPVGAGVPSGGGFSRVSLAFVKGPDGAELWAAGGGRGLFMSRDGGDHYAFMSAGTPAASSSHPVALVSHSDYSGQIWYAAREGVFRSKDSGLSWQELDAGLGAGPVEALLGPNNGQVYAAVEGAGIFMMPFDGATWSKAHALDFYGKKSDAWPGRLLASWWFPLSDATSASVLRVGLDPYGLFETKDSGATLQLVGAGLPEGRVLGLSRSPHDSMVVIAGASDGIYVSVDGGETFLPTSAGFGVVGLCFSFAFDAAQEGSLVALCAPKLPHGIPASGAESSGQLPRNVFRSVDGGAKWESAGAGLPEEGGVLQLIADPEEAGVVYAATALQGVLRSVDGGQTFEQWSTGLPAPTLGGAGALYAAPMALSGDGGECIVGTDGFGFYRRAAEGACQ